MTVELTGCEQMQAALVGIMRNVKSIAARRQNRHGADPANSWSLHIEGACGEAAVAKAMNIWWGGSVDTFKSISDVGAFEVRTRSRDDFELIVRRDDKDSDRFILVTGICPRYTIRGWIQAAEAKRPEWMKTHGGREEAWFVPHSALRPMSELMGMTCTQGY